MKECRWNCAKYVLNCSVFLCVSWVLIEVQSIFCRSVARDIELGKYSTFDLIEDLIQVCNVLSELRNIGLSLFSHEGAWICTNGIDNVDDLLNWRPPLLLCLKVKREVVAVSHWKWTALGVVVAFHLVGVGSSASQAAARCPCWSISARFAVPDDIVPHVLIAVNLVSWAAIEFIAKLP